jgi:hypothetical protein
MSTGISNEKSMKDLKVIGICFPGAQKPSLVNPPLSNPLSSVLALKDYRFLFTLPLTGFLYIFFNKHIKLHQTFSLLF